MRKSEHKHLKAVKREHKRRPKMAVHGRGLKTLPARGVLKVRRKKS